MAMLSVLFWNLMGGRRESLCANLVRLHDVDILVLAECTSPTAMRRVLNQRPTPVPFYWHRATNPSRVTVFSRFPKSEFAEVVSDQRYSVHALSGPSRPELVIVSVHATSGLQVDVVEQDEELRALAKRVTELEDSRGHTRTLLIGDLNADPYDKRVQTAVGLHGEKSRAIAQQGARRVKRVAYRFFYNPMWRFLGQQPPDPKERTTAGRPNTRPVSGTCSTRCCCGPLCCRTLRMRTF
jgi:endonuclease/exonuclease/phosphatase family metal-dependent hydrolase